MPEHPPGPDKLNVFISYSREDLAFADQLDATLRIGGFASTLDRHGIAGGEDWQSKLGTLIRDADTVVFVLTPASARSDICRWEVEEAERLAKRIIPVVPRSLDNAAAPKGLAALNYIYFYPEPMKPGTGFGPGLLELVTALKTDLDWLREHTRLLQRATEWVGAGRVESRLLFGDSIADARAWIARRPKDAPELTTLHHEFIRASEEADARRQSIERSQLEQIAAAQAERGRALAEKEAAQQRESDQTRRVVQRTRVGLGAALALAAVAGLAGWQAHLQTLEVERQKLVLSAANQRLSAEMKLRIAPFGKQAYAISQQWYKLATTNASSIAFIEVANKSKWQFTGTGFVVKGEDLYGPWRGRTLLVTAGHVADGKQTVRAYFPAIDAKRTISLADVEWSSSEAMEQVDIVIFRLAESLPLGAWPVAGVSDIDVAKWGIATMRSNGLVARSALSDPVPLIVLGAEVDEPYEIVQKDPSKAHPVLALSLSNALGRYQYDDNNILFTDSTTLGSSGSPVFDAESGALVAVVQIGSDQSKPLEDGLAYSGGIALSALKRAIRHEKLEVPLAQGRLLLEKGHDEDARALFENALIERSLREDRIARTVIDAVWAKAIVERGSKLLDEGRDAEAKARFDLALTRDSAQTSSVASAYVRRGDSLLKASKDDEAKTQFALALAQDSTQSATVASAYVARGSSLLKLGTDEQAKAQFDLALKFDANSNRAIAWAWIDALVTRASRLLEDDRDAEAKALLELALGRDPTEAAAVARAYLGHGESLLKRGKAGEARTQFDLALARDPTQTKAIASAYIVAGESSLELGRDEEAKIHFDQAVARDQTQSWAIASAYVQRGQKLLATARDEDAKTQFDRALRYDADSDGAITRSWFDALVARGSKLLEDGRDVAAREQFRLALARDPTQSQAIARAYVEHGERLLKVGKEEEAKRHFDVALGGDPAQSTAIAWSYVERGESLLKLGKDQQATAHFDRARKYSVDFDQAIARAWIDALVERGSKLLEEGRDAEARTQFDLALARDRTQSSAAHIRRGESLLKAGKDAQAEILLELALTQDAKSREAIDHAWTSTYIARGAALIKLGKYAEAKAQFDRAHARDPKTSHAIAQTWWRFPLWRESSKLSR